MVTSLEDKDAVGIDRRKNQEAVPYGFVSNSRTEICLVIYACKSTHVALCCYCSVSFWCCCFCSSGLAFAIDLMAINPAAAAVSLAAAVAAAVEA